jgi:transcriptional regulator with GAF, ATPase, and Fis domain
MGAEMGTGTRDQELGRFQHLLADLFARVSLTPSDTIAAAIAEVSAELDRLNGCRAAENAYLREEIKTCHNFDDLVGSSAALGAALAQVSQVAPTDSTVLLLGETGTGKELVARAIHARSARAKRPLVCVNCAALAPTLIESELFGHERGAFTNAVNMRQGRFELADGGTVFLDEIGDLPPEIQAKLLRVLQEGEFERVGASRSRRVDVRVIAATHHNLDQAVQARTFRADLYYRLSVFPVRLPALRERREDIPQLVWFFIQQRQRKLGRQIKNVPSAVMAALQRYHWPGNVRELENIVERAMIRATGDTLLLDEMFGVPIQQGTEESAVELNAVERTHIELILRECGGKINGRGNAAERLGIHPNSLRFRIKKLGVSRPLYGKGRPPAPVHSILRAVGA